MEHQGQGNMSYRGSTASMAATPHQRPGTPESSRNNPFGDEIQSQAGSRGVSGNPFGTPGTSRPASSFGSSSQVRGINSRFFHSRRVHKGEIDQPWKNKKDPKEKWVTIIPILGLLAGFGIAGFLIYDGYSSVVKHKYCSVMSDNFSGGFNTDIWTKEAEVGGFGNGQFEETTVTDENVFIQDGKLIIKPTLQDASLIASDYVRNLTELGICSSTEPDNCVTQTNVTSGEIIQPVKSGRINTKKGATIKYGRVEVTAKLPEGDWLWPAIWMLPVENKYGAWPRSGEIDIVESRGNDHKYAQGGNNIVSSALHWGPNSANDAWWRTNVKRSALHTTYAKTEHKFGLEWSQKYLFTYVDTTLLQVLYTDFKSSGLWARGGFTDLIDNKTLTEDPWGYTGHPATPFDEDFYLIINVAVGGTNGWFADGKSGKPWTDSAQEGAKSQFWSARDTWQKSWADGNPQMEVSKVEMWQQCDGDENN